MEVRPTHTRFCGGRSTPAMRAIRAPSLSLALLVLRVAADHSHHAAPMNDLALIANLSDRRPNFHFTAPFRAAPPPPHLLVAVNDAPALGACSRAQRETSRWAVARSPSP